MKIRASSYTAIEPSKKHAEQIKNTFQGLPLEINIQNNFFTPETRFGRTFDLIISSHSLYWFLPDPEPYILNALAYLEKRGAMVAYLQTPHAASHVLNLLLDDALPEDRAPNHKITSRTLTDILDKNDIAYESARLPGTFKADTLFEKQNKWLLKELVSFFLSVDARSLDSNISRRAEEALKMLSYKQGTDLKLNLEVGAITVFQDS